MVFCNRIELNIFIFLSENGAVKLNSLGKPISLVPNMCLLIFLSHGYTSGPNAFCKKNARRLFEFARQSVCADTNGNSENTFECSRRPSARCWGRGTLFSAQKIAQVLVRD
jgi:hypothetical protein